MKRTLTATTMFMVAMHVVAQPSDWEQKPYEKFTLTVTMGAYSKIYMDNNVSSTVMHGFKSMEECSRAAEKIDAALNESTALIGADTFDGNPHAQSSCRKQIMHRGRIGQ